MPRRRAAGEGLERVSPGGLPVVKGLRNPTPLRDLARGISFAALPRAAQILADPQTSTKDFVALLTGLMKFGLGMPSPAEMAASATDAEVQEAKALGLLKQALADPGVRSWAESHRPEWLREMVPRPEDMVTEGETPDMVPDEVDPLTGDTP